MIHVLDDKKTVFTAIQNTVLEKEDCDERLDKIGRILSKGKTVSLGGYGDLDAPRETNSRKYFLNTGHTLLMAVL